MPALRLIALPSWLATVSVAAAAPWTTVAHRAEYLHQLRDGRDLHAVLLVETGSKH